MSPTPPPAPAPATVRLSVRPTRSFPRRPPKAAAPIEPKTSWTRSVPASRRFPRS